MENLPVDYRDDKLPLNVMFRAEGARQTIAAHWLGGVACRRALAHQQSSALQFKLGV